MWEPGTKNSYHAMTFGFLAGELIRRVSGMSVGQFVATQLADPLKADVFIGLPLSEEHRVASLIAPRSEAALDLASLAPEAIAALINPPMAPTTPNQRAWRGAEIPAGNGHASALGLARLYAVLANGGSLGDVRIMRPDTIAALARVQTKRVDLMLGFAPYWGAGVAGNAAGLFGPKPNVFGHCGWGGSFGCADTQAAVSIGYVMNQMGERIVGDPRTTALCNAIYECV
jgi:CubicO group peptidase (beta-lactamase class C family)